MKENGRRIVLNDKCDGKGKNRDEINKWMNE